MAELAPDITIISEQYVDNDMQKAMDLTNDYISAHADLIGYTEQQRHRFRHRSCDRGGGA